MKGKLTIIHPQGHAVEVVPIDHAPDCQELQKLVKGYIECVPHFNRYKGEACVAFCNEEGKLDGLVANGLATGAWHYQLEKAGVPCHDVLVGPVVIVTGDDELLEAL